MRTPAFASAAENLNLQVDRPVSYVYDLGLCTGQEQIRRGRLMSCLAM